MACHSNRFAGSRGASAFVGALALAALTGGFALPASAQAADCVQQMSRMPISAPTEAAPVYRANMMRGGFAAPGATPARPRAAKAKAAASTAVRKARPVRKAGVRRPARKPAAGLRRAAVAPAAVPRLLQPTSMPAAARDLATPRTFALIASTVCETGPRPAAALGAPGEPGLPVDGLFPGTDTETVLPPIIGPGLPGTGAPPMVVVPGGPGTEPPVIPPPVIGPPPVVAVPEPGTWALLILGFGLVGARMRRRPRAPA